MWSFGAVMYEIWSIGHKPFENVNNSEVSLYNGQIATVKKKLEKGGKDLFVLPFNLSNRPEYIF